MSQTLVKLLSESPSIPKRSVGSFLALEVLHQTKSLTSYLEAVALAQISPTFEYPPGYLAGVLNSPIGISLAFYRLVGASPGAVNIGSGEVKSVLDKIAVPNLEAARTAMRHFAVQWPGAWASNYENVAGKPAYQGFFNSVSRASSE